MTKKSIFSGRFKIKNDIRHGKESIEMLKLMQVLRNRKGFTLMELIVVLIILAILIAALTPVLIGWINDARETAERANGRTVLLAIQTVVTEAKGRGTWGDGTTAVTIANTTTATIGSQARFQTLMRDAAVFGSTAATYNSPFISGLGSTPAVTGIHLDASGNVTGIRIRNTASETRNSDGEGVGVLLVGRTGATFSATPGG